MSEPIPNDLSSEDRAIRRRRITRWGIRFEVWCEVWARLADEGACDGVGGQEFRRVTAEWIAAPPLCSDEQFIRARANEVRFTVPKTDAPRGGPQQTG